jgi:hypothetical protein
LSHRSGKFFYLLLHWIGRGGVRLLRLLGQAR